jgi:hypothetical protein
LSNIAILILAQPWNEGKQQGRAENGGSGREIVHGDFDLPFRPGTLISGSEYGKASVAVSGAVGRCVKQIPVFHGMPRVGQKYTFYAPSLARARARAISTMISHSKPPTQYNSDEDDVPVFEELKKEFPGLTFLFDEDAHDPSFRWKAGVYEPKFERIVLPGTRQSVLLRNFRVIAHTATRRRALAGAAREGLHRMKLQQWRKVPSRARERIQELAGSEYGK